jgi:hypothetical protein
MLRAYFDDSGTHAASDVVVAGGLIGTPDQWENFEKAWNTKLAAPLPGKPALKKFSLADCNSGKGEFIGYTQGERDAAMHDFRQVLVDAELIGTASAVDRKAWEELVVGPALAIHGSPLEQCIQNCVVETFKIAGPHPEGDRVAVVIDRGIWTQRLKDIIDHFALTLSRPHIASINFLTVAATPGLQGADTIATENFWHAKHWLQAGNLTQPRSHMRHFLARMRTEGFIVDREAIVAMLKDWAPS